MVVVTRRRDFHFCAISRPARSRLKRAHVFCFGSWLDSAFQMKRIPLGVSSVDDQYSGRWVANFTKRHSFRDQRTSRRDNVPTHKRQTRFLGTRYLRPPLMQY